MYPRPVSLQLPVTLGVVICLCCLHCLAVTPQSPTELHSIRDATVGGSSSSSTVGSTGASCSVTHAKQDCGYMGIQQSECESKPCCWQPAGEGSSTPWCYYPQEPPAPTYTVAERNDTDEWTSQFLLQLSNPMLPQYGPDFQQLAVLVEAQTPQRAHIKITPVSDTPRWEVPEFLIPRPSSIQFDPAVALYSVQLPSQGEPFAFAVKHKNSQQQRQQHTQRQQVDLVSVFDTSGFSLIFKEQYMEITTMIRPSTAVYGLGETTQKSGHLKLPRNGRIVTLWNYDIGCYNTDINLYGSHPFYLQVDPGGVAVIWY